MSEAHVLLSFPIVVMDEIMKNLSPLDYLNLARVDKELYKFVYNYPKKFARCSELSEEGVVRWNNDPSQPRYTRIYHTKRSEKAKESIMKHNSKNRENIFNDNSTWEENELRYEADMKILFNNATIDSFYAHTGLLDLKIKTTHIYPSGENADSVLEQIRHFGASELHFPTSPEYFEDDYGKLMDHELFRNLSYVHLHLSQEYVPSLLKLTSPRMEIWSDDVDVLVDTVDKMVQEWLEDRRKINILKFSLPISHRELPNESSGDLEDPLNEKYNLIAGKLAENREGGFVETGIDRRFKLLKRHDGKGLFIFSGLVHLVVIECDYALRSQIALGEEIKVDNNGVHQKILQREKKHQRTVLQEEDR